ncbi:MAG: 2-phospho-L-lactate transferase [Bryobacterales bacterium]|nr:2-phospho-L-lactate transferase [Bryobacterales bacterium]
MIVALAGGVGAARFLDGLSRVYPPKEICIIGNTGDDMEMHGLYICPDLDTVVYTLAGLANPVHGWGVEGDSFRCLEALGRLNADTWFQLGDRDLATHIYRTARLRAGESLSTVTAAIARALGVVCILKPVSDDPVRTIVQTPGGPLEFQTYFVRRRARDEVLGVEFQGAEEARPAPGVLRDIRSASAIVICPSNPIISIGPILAVPGIRRALRRRKCPAAAISPIIGGRALKGPAADMMRGMGMEVSALGVARMYRGLVDLFVLDRADKRLAPEVEKLGMRAVVTNTIMTGPAQKKALARAVLQALGRT